MRHRERGAALLEVLAAIVILAVAGLSLVELLGGETRALRQAVVLERELADEERLLAAYALLSRTDLDRRLGTSETGPYRVGIERPERALYRIAVARTAAPGVEDLVTVVFRPEPRDAP